MWSRVGLDSCHMGRIDCFSPMVITPINFFSHDLWQWLAAAFPDAKYCLASATLTDAAVRDMQGVLVSLVLQFMLFHLTNSSFTAHQARGDEDSLQRVLAAQHLPAGSTAAILWTATCTSSHQLRHYDVPADDNYHGIFSFLLPIIADESRIGTQIFFRRKDSLNSASKDYDSHWHITLKRLINALLSQLGAFLKKTARQLQVETLQEDTIRV